MTEKLQSILDAEGLSSLLDKFNEQGVTDSILGDLTDSDLKELGIDKLGERKRLLAAFGKSGGGAVAVSGVEESSAQTSGGAVSKTAATPAEATKDSPWVNTLGMPFVPIPRFETRFCVWPVRVQDYEAYCIASGAKFPEIPFAQEPDHPVLGVSWTEAIEFCVWLTCKEQSEGKLTMDFVYRLPTDLEWSAAVGLPPEEQPTPEARHLKETGYPWGLRWPPPANAGNYEHERSDQWGLRFLKEDNLHTISVEAQRESKINEQILAEGNSINPEALARSEKRERLLKMTNDKIGMLYDNWRKAWKAVDNFEYTSPVASFMPNDHGLYDLGGNVWEWCMDLNASGNDAVLRGASYALWREGATATEVGSVQVSKQGARAYFDQGLNLRDFSSAEVKLPVPNQDVYKSSFRAFCSKEQPLAVSVYQDDALRDWPVSGVRLVMANLKTK